MTPWILAAERILIQVHLFQGVWMEDQPGLKKIEVLTTASRQELSILKDKAKGSEGELTAAVINALLDLYGFQTMEDLFLHQKWWDGSKLHDIQWDGSIRPRKDLPFPFDVVFGRTASYGIKLSPKTLPSQQLALHAVISKTKNNPNNWKDMEVIVDQELVLGVGDPVIVGVPYQGRAHFMIVLLTVGDPSAKRPEPEIAKKIDFVAAPNAIIQVQPSYPQELRRRLIGGEIGLQITIDKKGVVQRVDVKKSLYPYLDYLAVQAFRQWTFEPVRIEGKPVPAAFRFTHNFYPWAYAQENPRSDTPPFGSGYSSREELRAVLAGSGDYCQKLASAVLDFICEETIKETHYNLLKNPNWMYLFSGPRSKQTEQGRYYEIPPDSKPSVFMNFFGAAESKSEKIEDTGQNRMEKVTAFQYMDPKLTMRNNFLCDYLIVKKGEAVEERRIILKENGRKNADRNKLLEETRFSGLSSLFAPLRVLAKERQQRFNYRIIDEERARGKNAYVIAAAPESKDEDGIWSARVWVDKKSFQVLQCEIEGIPIDGYEDVLNDCAILNIKPIFLTRHEYQIEKNGVMFPSRSKVYVAYPGIDYRGTIEKNSIQLSYDKYEFFMVETEHRIIK